MPTLREGMLVTIADGIHQLTAEHMTISKTGEFVKAAPLLAQLRAASGSNLGAQGGGSGGGGLVVNSKAVKIENGIKEQALNEHFEMTGKEYRGPLVDLIRSWAALEGEWAAYIERVLLEWIDDIRDMLAARRPPWRPSLPCPACGQRFYGVERDPCLAVHFWDDEAEAVAPLSKWIAKCDGCGAEWNGDNLKWLRAASDTTDKVVAQVS
jgi:hypothetical protein